MFSWLDNNFSISIEPDFSRNRVTLYVSHGETMVMCIGRIGDWCDSDGFTPLRVDYFERAYAINKIPGGFIKKESRQKESEVLISRLIDRSIRPTIAPSFKFEINLSCFVLSYSRECPAEPLCITACSAALQILGVPSTIVAGVKVFHTDKWSTTYSKARSVAFIAGNHYGISSFEFSGGELPLQDLSEVISIANPKINFLLEKILEMISTFQRPEYALPFFEKNSSVIDANLMLKSYRAGDLSNIQLQKMQFLANWKNQKLGEAQWNEAVREVLRQSLFWTEKRLDGRGFEHLREMEFEAPFLKKLHGSSVFSKGGTKCICAVTIGSNTDSQLYESLEWNENRKMILNYNFLGGDEKINGSSNRREIGHGNLARNAFKNFISDDKFIRIVSEVISSDGSSSMATVCAAWLALKVAGIRLSQTIAGISVGLIYKDFLSKFLVDLTELEDSLSDMDLKVAGTHKGFTSIQMDLKVQYLPWDIFKKALSYSFSQLKVVIQKIEKEIIGSSPEHSTLNALPSLPEPAVNQKEITHKIIEKVNEKRNFTDGVKQKIEIKNEARELLAEPNVASKQISPHKAESNQKQDLVNKNNIDQEEKNQNFSLRLSVEKINLLKPMLENLRSETQSNIYIKNESINIYSSNLEKTCSKILSLAYQTEKELHYAKVEKISDKTIDFVLIEGKKGSIAKNDRIPELKKGSNIIVYKGRKWTFFNILG